jgi:hypothetical protein
MRKGEKIHNQRTKLPERGRSKKRKKHRDKKEKEKNYENLPVS